MNFVKFIELNLYRISLFFLECECPTTAVLLINKEGIWSTYFIRNKSIECRFFDNKYGLHKFLKIYIYRDIILKGNFWQFLTICVLSDKTHILLETLFLDLKC